MTQTFIAREATYKFKTADGGEPQTKTVFEHPDGIYLDLPELDYLNDWALSYSAYKTLNSSPPDWHWDSVFNLIEDKTRKGETPAMKFGSALHCALLEPAGTYDKRYGVPPQAEDYPKALKKVEEIKDALKSMGVSPGKLNKGPLIDLLLEHDPKAEIFDAILDGWRKENIGKIEMSPEEDAKIRLMVQLATRHPALVQAFTGVGLSEVAVFFTDSNGVRQRARFDRLKPMASIDLKSFSNWQGRDFRKALLREAALRQYDLQAAHYDVARQEMRRLCAEGKVFVCYTETEAWTQVGGESVLAWEWTDGEGEVHTRLQDDGTEDPLPAQTYILPATKAQLETVRAVILPKNEAGDDVDVWEWIWIFYKTDGAPTAQVVRLKRDLKAFQRGVDRRVEALAHFMHYRDMFGLTQMWIRLDPMWTPDDSDWPFFMDSDS